MSQISHVLAETPEIDLAVLAAEIEELEEYIVKGEVYRTLRVPTPSSVQQVQMSGGDVLTRLFRLEGERESLPVEQRSRVKDLVLQARSTIYSLRTRFHDLLKREIKARIDSLNWFLDDVLGDPKRATHRIPLRDSQSPAHRRRWLTNWPKTSRLNSRRELKRVDERIRLIVQPASFAWDSRLESLFPRERFWYLYVSP
jgi:hypothetical protein